MVIAIYRLCHRSAMFFGLAWHYFFTRAPFWLRVAVAGSAFFATAVRLIIVCPSPTPRHIIIIYYNACRIRYTLNYCAVRNM